MAKATKKLKKLETKIRKLAPEDRGEGGTAAKKPPACLPARAPGLPGPPR
jgi:hypothetical protein